MILAHFLYSNACMKGRSKKEEEEEEGKDLHSFLINVVVTHRRRMRANDVGYILRKVGMDAHFLELCWCPFSLLLSVFFCILPRRQEPRLVTGMDAL